MSRNILDELKRVAPLVLLAVLAGLLTSGIAWWLLGAVIVYAGWQLVNVASLNQWLAEGRVDELPDAYGIWGEVFTRLHHRERRVRKRQQRMTRLLEQFQRATQALPDGVVILGQAGEITAFNNSGRDLLGLRRPEDFGRPITNFLRQPEVNQFIEESDPEATLLIDSPVRANRSLLLQVRPYARGGGRLFIARDVTRLQRLERMRQDFVANVSHELKSPLTVIQGYAEHLERLDDENVFEAMDDHTRRTLTRSVHQLQAEAGRMRLLVDDLLELSRLEATDADDEAEFGEVSVQSILHQIRDEALALCDSRHTIELNVDARVGVLGNGRELYTAFSNIVFNAVRYMDEPGTVTISWQLRHEAPVLTVSDEGPGVPQEALPRLTERFFRVDDGRARSDGGTGLGLAISKHVMLRHEGTIDITSELGEGTTVSCRFSPRRACVLDA